MKRRVKMKNIYSIRYQAYYDVLLFKSVNLVQEQANIVTKQIKNLKTDSCIYVIWHIKKLAFQTIRERRNI